MRRIPGSEGSPEEIHLGRTHTHTPHYHSHHPHPHHHHPPTLTFAPHSHTPHHSQHAPTHHTTHHRYQTPHHFLQTHTDHRRDFSIFLSFSPFSLFSLFLLAPRRCRHQFLCGHQNQHIAIYPHRGLISKPRRASEEGAGGGGRWRRRECKNKNKSEQQGEAGWTVTYRRIEQPGCRVGRGQVAGPGITRILNERDKVSGFDRSVAAKYKRDSWFLSITNPQFILHASLTPTHSLAQSLSHPIDHSLALTHPRTHSPHRTAPPPPSLPPRASRSHSRTPPLVSASLRFVCCGFLISAFSTASHMTAIMKPSSSAPAKQKQSKSRNGTLYKLSQYTI